MATSPHSVRRAMLEGALHKAKDAVHADRTQDFPYAMRAYADSCALLSRVMDRTERETDDWIVMDTIRNQYIKRLYEIRESYPRYSPTRSPRSPQTPKL